MAKWFRREVTDDALDVTVFIEAAEGGDQWHLSWFVGDKAVSGEKLLVKFGQIRRYRDLLETVAREMQELARVVWLYEILTPEWKTLRDIRFEVNSGAYSKRIPVPWPCDIRHVLGELSQESDVECVFDVTGHIPDKTRARRVGG